MPWFRNAIRTALEDLNHIFHPPDISLETALGQISSNVPIHLRPTIDFLGALRFVAANKVEMALLDARALG